MYFSGRTEQKRLTFFDTKLMSLLLLIAYIIHQTEEHWVDLFPEVAYFAALVIWSVTPVFLFNSPESISQLQT